MFKQLCGWFSILVILASAGCGPADRAELEKAKADLAKTQAELDKAQAELKALKSQALRQSYLDELERLETLKSKGALTQAEFDAKKAVVLKMVDKQPLPTSPMNELETKIRELQSLYGNNTLTPSEYQKKKAQLLAKPIALTDLKRDLEIVQKLYGENLLTPMEFNTLKSRLLEIDPDKK